MRVMRCCWKVLCFLVLAILDGLKDPVVAVFFLFSVVRSFDPIIDGASEYRIVLVAVILAAAFKEIRSERGHRIAAEKENERLLAALASPSVVFVDTQLGPSKAEIKRGRS